MTLPWGQLIMLFYTSSRVGQNAIVFLTLCLCNSPLVEAVFPPIIAVNPPIMNSEGINTFMRIR